MSHIKRVIDLLDRGRLTPDQAVRAILAPPKKPYRNRSTHLKLAYKGRGKRKFGMRIPLGLLTLTLSLSSPVVKYVLRKVAAKYRLDIPRDFKPRSLVSLMRKYGPFKLVEVSDKDTYVLVQLY